MKVHHAAQSKRVKDINTLIQQQLARNFVETVTRARKGLPANSNITAASKAIIAGAKEYADAISQAYELVGQSEAGTLSRRLGMRIKFNPEHWSIRTTVAKARTRFLSNFGHTQRQSIAQAVARANKRAGDNYPIRKAAPDGAANDALGLTGYQEQMVETYRQALAAGSSDALDRALRDRRFDSTVENAVVGGEPLSWDQIDRMTERYRDRMIAYRADVIARTDALAATNAARTSALIQAAEQASFDPDTIIRTWNAVGDKTTRDTHFDLDGEEVEGMETPWESASGALLLYPGDPSAPANEVINCRCWMTYDLPGENPPLE